jgi:hypothetical protein
MKGEISSLPLYGIEEVRLCAGLSKGVLGKRATTTKLLSELAQLEADSAGRALEEPIELVVITGESAQILYDSIKHRAMAGPFVEASEQAQHEANAAQAVHETQIATQVVIRLAHAA